MNTDPKLTVQIPWHCDSCGAPANGPKLLCGCNRRTFWLDMAFLALTALLLVGVGLACIAAVVQGERTVEDKPAVIEGQVYSVSERPGGGLIVLLGMLNDGNIVPFTSENIYCDNKPATVGQLFDWLADPEHANVRVSLDSDGTRFIALPMH